MVPLCMVLLWEWRKSIGMLAYDVGTELHTAFLQHNGLVHSRKHRTFGPHIYQPICTTCNESMHKCMLTKRTL